MLEAFSQFVVARARLIVALMLLLTAGLVAPMRSIPVDTDVESFIPAGDDALSNLRTLEDVFGSPLLTMIIVLREDHPEGIFNPESLGVVYEITEWLRSRQEFETGTNADLRSLASVNDIRGEDDDMVVNAFFDEIPESPEAAAAIRDRVLENGIYVGSLAAFDGNGAAILVRNSDYGVEHHRETYFALRAHLDELEAGGAKEAFHLTGRPVVEALFGLYIPAEGRRMVPRVIALIAVLLFIAFRTIRGVALPLLVIVCTEIWMLGIHGLWGEPFYTLSSILPILVIAVSVADAIHLLARYYEVQEEQPDLDRNGVVQATIADMARPIFLTSLTTAAGFLSMTASSMKPIHDFGITMIFGITAAWVLSIVFLPALLSLLPLRPLGAKAATKHMVGDSRLERFLRSSVSMTIGRPGQVTLGFLLLAAFCFLGTRSLKVDSSQVTQFRPAHELRLADSISNRHFAGGTVLDIMIDGGEPGAMKSPAMLAAIAKLQSELESSEDVGDTLSIAEMVAQMNRIMHSNDDAFEKVPESQELVAQYLLLYSISGDPGDFDDLVDYDYRYAHVIAFLRDPGTAVARAVVEAAKTEGAMLFAADGPAPAKVILTGPAYTVSRMEAHISRDQINTLRFCTPVLIIMNWFMFGSLLYGVLSIVPVLFAVLAAYGGMGHVGMPADVATVMLGGMTLGIGVDFAIHYLHRYRHLAKQSGADHQGVLNDTALSAGRALFVNAMVLVGGFLVMLGSRFYPQMKLGVMVALTMLVCYASTMYLFPAILTLQHRQKGSKP